MNNADFVEQVARMAEHCTAASASKGFWATDTPETDTVKIMLIVTELAEGVEGLRHGNPPSDHIPEFSSIEEELADAFIRMADLWHRRGWRVPEAVVAKLEFNAGRAHMHGKGF